MGLSTKQTTPAYPLSNGQGETANTRIVLNSHAPFTQQASLPFNSIIPARGPFMNPPRYLNVRIIGQHTP
eukprot:4881366-Amphidinium_carterae.1